MIAYDQAIPLAGCTEEARIALDFAKRLIL
jgi:hypothetical protein